MTKKKTEPTGWIGLPDDLTGYEGFVYLITNKQTGQKYVGRKYLWSRTTVKQVGKKRRKKVVKHANWQTYKSSCEDILREIATSGADHLEFRILHLCKTRAETNFLETQEQFDRRVLSAKLPNGQWEYYNGNILSRYFRATEPK